MLIYQIISTILIVCIILIFSSLKEQITPIILENDYIKLTNLLNIDSEISYKKRYKTLIITISLLIFYPITSFNNLLLMTILLTIIIIYKQDYWKMKAKLNKEVKMIRFEFPIWLRQVQVLMQINTVAKALEISLEKAPIIIKKDLELMVKNLKENPNSIDCYTNFLSSYPLKDITRIMKMLYRYSIVGQKDAYKQLNRQIMTSNKMLRQERNDLYDSNLSVYQWWGIVPLFGVTVLFLIIMISYLLEMMKGGVM